MQAADVIQTQIPYTVSADANDYVVRVSRMSPDDLATTFHLFLRRLTLVKEKIPYLKAALTLELDALLWTGDKELRNGLRTQGFERFFVPG